MFKHVVPASVIAQERLQTSVLGPVAGAYAEYLIQHGYAGCTIENYLQCVTHFARWLAKQRIELQGIDDAVLHRFSVFIFPSAAAQPPVHVPAQIFAARCGICFVCCARKVMFRRDQCSCLRQCGKNLSTLTPTSRRYVGWRQRRASIVCVTSESSCWLSLAAARSSWQRLSQATLVAS